MPVSHSNGLRTAFPHATIEVWHGMGHHPLSERFDDLLALIDRTLAEVPPRKTGRPRHYATAA